MIWVVGGGRRSCLAVVGAFGYCGLLFGGWWSLSFVIGRGVVLLPWVRVVFGPAAFVRTAHTLWSHHTLLITNQTITNIPAAGEVRQGKVRAPGPAVQEDARHPPAAHQARGAYGRDREGSIGRSDCVWVCF